MKARKINRKSKEIMSPANNQPSSMDEISYNNRQEDMQNYLQNEGKIIYKGYIDSEKRSYNTRILSINVNSMRFKDNEKIHQLIDYCEKY